MAKKKQLTPDLRDPESFPLIHDERPGEDFKPTWKDMDVFIRFLMRDDSLTVAEINEVANDHSKYEKKQESR